MAELVRRQIRLTGITSDPTDDNFVSASPTGDEFKNDGQTFIEIRNANISTTRTVTFKAQVPSTEKQGYGKIELDDVQVIVPIDGEARVAEFGPTRFGANDRVQVTYSDAGADVTVAAFNIKRVI